MSNEHDYKCTECGNVTARHMLTVKRVQFGEMGTGGTINKSRVVAWLCVTCTKADPAWNMDPNIIPQRVPRAKVAPSETDEDRLMREIELKL